MKKKTLLLMILILLTTIVLTLIFTTFPTPVSADSGTCCKQKDSLCVVGNNGWVDRYFLGTGPCPPKK